MKGRKRAILSIALMTMTPSAQAKSMNKTKAIIHHTASHDVSAAEIDRWHRAQGWDCIGYHFVIRADGTIERGRDINKIGAHAKGRNHHIGIALTGYDEFTPEQIRSLIVLLKQLGVNYIERHHEECPGNGFDIELVRLAIDKKYARRR